MNWYASGASALSHGRNQLSCVMQRVTGIQSVLFWHCQVSPTLSEPVSSPLLFEAGGRVGGMPSWFDVGFICRHFPGQSSRSHLLQWHVTPFPFASQSPLLLDPLAARVPYQSKHSDADVHAAVQTQSNEWMGIESVFCFTYLNYSGKISQMFINILTALFFHLFETCRCARRDWSGDSALVRQSFSLAVELWNPSWLKHQSDILKLSG